MRPGRNVTISFLTNLSIAMRILTSITQGALTGMLLSFPLTQVCAKPGAAARAVVPNVRFYFQGNQFNYSVPENVGAATLTVGNAHVVALKADAVRPAQA